MRETIDENGAVITEKLDIPIYSESETDYYVDTYSLRVGDNICKPDSMDKYPISKIGTLIGVYNINKGYAVFKQIEILKSNGEYYTIKKGTKYGLSVYDHIVLNADSVYEGKLIYQ